MKKAFKVCLSMILSAAMLITPCNIAFAVTDEPTPYTISEEPSLTIVYEDSPVSLYEKTYFIDINGDQRYNTQDCRLLLRMAIGLDSLPNDIRSIDFDIDGAITSSDARGSLRYTIGLARLFCDKDGMIPVGFFPTPDGDVFYFDHMGTMAIGYMKIDDAYSYFDNEGRLCTGWVTVAGRPAFFDEYGRGLDGLYQIDDAVYYLVNGITQSGWQYLDGLHYYFFQDGTMATGNVTIDGQNVSFFDDGTLCNGIVTEAGTQYEYRYGIRFPVGLLDDPGANSSQAAKNAAAERVAKYLADNISGETDLERVSLATRIVYIFSINANYTMEGDDYDTPYGVFIKGECSCAGSTRALGLVLTYMGFSWEHVNEHLYTHQWCELTMDGQHGWADADAGFAGYGEYPFA